MMENSRHYRRRAAWIAHFLGAVVVLFAAPFGEAFLRHAPAKLSFAFVSENVLISDVTKEINERSPFQKLIAERIGEGLFVIRPKTPLFEFFAASENISGDSSGIQFPPSLRRKVGNRTFYADFNLPEYRGGFSMIDERVSHAERFRGRRASEGYGGLWLDIVVFNTQKDVAPFNSRQRVGGFFGGSNGNSGEFISSDEKDDLCRRYNRDESSEYAQDERIKRDWIIPSPIPDYRKPLPKGFGWLIIIGAIIGGGTGVAYVLLVIWLVSSPRNAPTNGEAH